MSKEFYQVYIIKLNQQKLYIYPLKMFHQTQ